MADNKSSNKQNKAPFIQIPKGIEYDNRVSDGALRVYLALKSFAREKDSTYVSAARLALELRVTERSVRRRLKLLSETGWVQVESRGSGRSSNKTLLGIYTTTDICVSPVCVTENTTQDICVTPVSVDRNDSASQPRTFASADPGHLRPPTPDNSVRAISTDIKLQRINTKSEDLTHARNFSVSVGKPGETQTASQDIPCPHPDWAWTQVMECWNSYITGLQYKTPLMEHFSRESKQNYIQVLKTHPEFWEVVKTQLNKPHKYLMGAGWFSLDWLTRPAGEFNNFRKFKAGNYADAEKKAPAGKLLSHQLGAHARPITPLVQTFRTSDWGDKRAN